MDYLELPRELIYKERRNLEDFADENEDLELLIDSMISNYYFSSANGKIRVLRCFNTAYYLCTLILLCDKHADWNFAKYCDIACCNEYKSNVYQAFTLSLVYIFLTHTYYEVPCKKLIEKLNDFLSSKAHYLQIGAPFLNDYFYSDVCNDLQKDLPEDWLLSEEFKPRKIDNDIYHDVDKHNSAWYKLTEYYRRKVVIKIVQSLGKDAGEKKILVDLIRRDAERFYGSDSAAYTDQVKPLLDEIERSICGDISEDDSPAPVNLAGAGYEEEALLSTIESLRNDLNAFNTRDKEKEEMPLFTVKQIAIFLKAILLHHNSLTNNAKNLAPLVQRFGGGFSASTAQNALGYAVTQKECDDLEAIFRDYAPAIGNIIKEYPMKFKEIKEQKLQNNLNN